MRHRIFPSADAGPRTAAGRGGGAELTHPVVRTGFDLFAADGYQLVAGKKFGIIANPTAIESDFTHEVDVMHAAAAVNLTAVFGPEHGFRGTAQAGGGVGTYTDPKTGLPVYNMYGADVADTVTLVRQSGVQALGFDIQDVGARFYTYIWTMYLGLAAAAVLGIPFIVLDRPNPLGGARPSGPVMRPQLETFVGMKPICQQHAMTVGELALLFNDQFVPADAGGRKAELTVVAMRGWRRGMYYDQTGLPWVMPSPNMPTSDTALVYYGLCLFEGTNLSEGRGTTRPFELVTAPYIDYHWLDTLNAELETNGLHGTGFREEYVRPTFDKYENTVCGGLQCYITDRGSFDAITTAVAMLVTVRRQYPGGFGWQYPGRDAIWVDKLSGSDWIRTSVDAGKDTAEIVAGWQAELAEFARLRKEYLMYREDDPS
ncbi:exo-beta-N-acetylmuramidase NamZ domain-containing protein [Nocardia sp. NPDC050175]|uniref:exo-beta-N-acetylmuramidase NamZ family protein n=1 Tax=Nocardia sp. NPDC050175 TaxID=3364317 RepID=UPI00379A2985